MEWFMQGSDQIWSWVIAQRAIAVAAVDLSPLEDGPSGLDRDIRRHPPFNKDRRKILESVKSPCANNAMRPGWVQSNQIVIYIVWMDDHADHIRKPRADAVRNRERVLEAAKAVFSAGGPEASLEAVAKHAGVGIGTLYRHFPTREALFEAVYRREVEQLSELAEQLKNAKDPVDALRRWLRSNVEFVATKKGMSAALALTFQSSSELAAFSLDRLTRAVGSLLDRAVAAGEMRADISPEDLLRALVGMCYMHDQPGWQSSVLRMLDVFVDGLRVQAGIKTKTRAAKTAKPAAKRKR
jgi:AcrR family transcriptional regulator